MMVVQRDSLRVMGLQRALKLDVSTEKKKLRVHQIDKLMVAEMETQMALE